jgi:hypothetical protein
MTTETDAANAAIQSIDFTAALRPKPDDKEAANPDVAERQQRPTLHEAATRFGDMVVDLQDSEKRARAERDAALARVEQMQSTITDLRSQIESERLRADQARQTWDTERAERIRLASVIEMLISQATHALKQP